MSIYDLDCKQGCRLLKVEKDKLEAVKTWLTKAKAQGHISISQGEALDEILGAERASVSALD